MSWPEVFNGILGKVCLNRLKKPQSHIWSQTFIDKDFHLSRTDFSQCFHIRNAKFVAVLADWFAVWLSILPFQIKGGKNMSLIN